MHLALLALAVPPRLFTYAVFFRSLQLAARAMAGRASRAICLGGFWVLAGLGLLAFDWTFMATGGDLMWDASVKRFSPVSMASFQPDTRLAVIALGQDHVANYTWARATTYEVIGLVLITALVAFFVWSVSRHAPKRAAAAPLVGAIGLAICIHLVPWSVIFDWDIFVGDALLGPTALNMISAPTLLIFGGYPGPAVGVTLAAAIQMGFFWRWRAA